MKIAEIRNVIDSAGWTRADLTGGTSEEFRKQQVGPSLRAHVAKLQALEIPERFARDIANRDREIVHAEKVIARWEAVQTPVVPAPAIAPAPKPALALVVADEPQMTARESFSDTATYYTAQAVLLAKLVEQANDGSPRKAEKLKELTEAVSIATGKLEDLLALARGENVPFG